MNEQRNNSGALFKNDRREKDSWPEWKSIPRYPVYFASKDGRIARLVNGKLRIKATTTASKYSGYCRIGLWDGKDHTEYVHRLILETFIGPCPDKHEALHGDGTRTNNSLSNLRWGTRAENVADAAMHGTDTSGYRNGGAKLTKLDVLWLRDLRDTGFSVKECARHFKHISNSTLRAAYRGVRYKNV